MKPSALHTLILAILVFVSGCSSGSKPISLTFPSGATQAVDTGQNVTITVNGAGTKGVTWSLSGPGSLSNQTLTSVVYTAPTSAAAVTARLTTPASASRNPAATPTDPTATVTATSVASPSKTATVTVTVTSPPAITTTTLPADTEGTAYTQTIAASGGAGTLSFSISTGSLPAGLSMDTSGKITGTPTGPNATASFTVKATDSSSGGPLSATQNLSIAINLPPAPTITTASLPAGVEGTAYNQMVQASAGLAPYTFAVTAGTLPAGLSMDATGHITGTPTGPNITSTFTVTVTDKSNPAQTGSKSLSITVNLPPPPSISPATLPNGSVGTPYSQTLTVSAGLGPTFTWVVSTGTLPSGLALVGNNATATISGTPTTIQSSDTFRITVTDSSNPVQSATRIFTLTITAPVISVTFSMAPPASLVVGSTANITASVSNDASSAGVDWTATCGSTGACGSFNPAHTASGAATVYTAPASVPAGTTVTITATSTADNTKFVSATVTISAVVALSITTTSPLAGATLGTSYSAMVTATGGATPYTWTVATGSSLPAGLSLISGSPSATISGTPTATGTFQFSLKVTDSSTPTPATVSATFMLTVTGSSTLNCPGTVNLTLCGTYAMGFRGFNASGPVAGGIVFVANNSGQIISGMKEVNQSTGAAAVTITGGSFVMDSSGDGRGVLTLIDSTAASTTFRFVLESLANAGFDQIEEFDNSGTIASGVMLGPEAGPLPQVPANAGIALELEGINGSGQRSALLGIFQFGPHGCDGTAGSFSSVPGEPLFANTAGTVNASLTATGSCTPVDPNTGIGTAQLTLAGGNPFTNSTLHFTYVIVGSSSGIQGGFFLDTDAIGANQPILSGLAESAQPPAGGYNASSLGCPCLFGRNGTTDGTSTTGRSLASIIRLVTTPGTGASGTLTGVEDRNAGGTVTLANALGPYNYTVDLKGVGTISAPSLIHIVIVSDTTFTVDESVSVLTGTFRPQNATTIQNPGLPYITGLGNGNLLGVNPSVDNVVGVITPSGATSGTLTGTVDNVSSTGNTVGVTVSGTYAGIDANGRGTGTLNLTGGTGSPSIIIYASRGRQFVILDAQSANPYLLGARLQ
jgi:hypothetical protein